MTTSKALARQDTLAAHISFAQAESLREMTDLFFLYIELLSERFERKEFFFDLTNSLQVAMGRFCKKSKANNKEVKWEISGDYCYREINKILIAKKLIRNPLSIKQIRKLVGVDEKLNPLQVYGEFLFNPERFDYSEVGVDHAE